MRSDRRYFAVLNPAAGGGKCGKKAPEALGRLRNEGFDLTVTETHAPREATALVQAAYRDGHRHFLSIGGDGTSFEIVNGLLPLIQNPNDRVSIALLPLGTGNSFLKDFTKDGVDYTFEAMRAGKKRPCDVLALEHKGGTYYFINMLSTGWVADVGLVTNVHFKPFGPFGYVLGVLTKLPRLHPTPFPVRLDHDEYWDDPITFLSIGNSRFTGGNMMMAPHADTGDGFADLIWVKRMSRTGLLKSFPKIFKGTHTDLPAVAEKKIRCLDFHVDREFNILLDGEFVQVQPKRLYVLSAAIDVEV